MAKAAAKRSTGSAGKLKAHGRSLADFVSLLPAEKTLLEACRMGMRADIGEGKRPENLSDDNQVRPGFIRFLALGGDDRAPVHEKGVQIAGAWIDGDLDLEACHCVAPILIHGCKIAGDVIVRDATLSILSLVATAIDSLQGDRLTTFGAILLRDGFSASGEVRLLGAKIGGDLSCNGGKFEAKEGNALSCDGADISGAAFFANGFHATAEVRLLGANIGGDLSCKDGKFEPKEGSALSCEGAKIGGVLFFRKVAKITGHVSFMAAEVNSLSDDRESWALAPHLMLDGFRYGRIVEGPTDAATRIAWLKMQFAEHLKEEFRPQPWEQLIKVLRDMGHEADARKIAIEKQKALYAAGKITGILRPLHKAYGLLAGYGHKPMRTICAMLLVWFAASLMYFLADQKGLMAPASPIIHADVRLQDSCGGAKGIRETSWTQCASLPQEYTTFYSFAYSFDLILPLVDLQQDEDWAPITTKNDGKTWIGLGLIARLVTWFEILFGWTASLLLVAVLGNLVKKD